MSAEPGIAVSGLVLAGGRSSRFGSDKLAVIVNGRPLVHHAIAALASICDEVLVIVEPSNQPGLPAGLRVPVRIVHDSRPGSGPLGGLIDGLAAARGSWAVVAAGDMPALVPELLQDLLDRARAAGSDAGVLEEGGQIRPLPAAMNRLVALDRGRSVRALGGSSLRMLIAQLRVIVCAESEWSRLDPTGRSLQDIDRPADLAR